MKLLEACVAAGVAGGSLLLSASAAHAGLTAEEVLVVVNDSSDLSMAVGEYYAALRGIPSENVLHLPPGTATAETIDRATYNAQIRDVVRNYLEFEMPHLREQVLCIVTTKDVPLRIDGGIDAAAVDSELTQLFTGWVGEGGQDYWVGNVYWGNRVPFRRFRDELGHADAISYLVTRITGYQTDVDPVTGVPRDILNLMNRSVAPPVPGVFLLDQDPTRTGDYAIGNDWMIAANDALLALGESTVIDSSTTFVHDQENILGYVSWGANDCCTAGRPYYGEVPPGSGTVYPGTFLPRSICTNYVSRNGRTFTDGMQDYGQCLVADLVRVAACGGGGHVYEPYLGAVPQPQELFVAYVRGYSAAEAYYQSFVALSWMNVIVCDPLMVFRDFAPPTPVSVDPPEGRQAGGDVVLVAGLEFREDVEVLFAGVPAPSVTWLDLTTLEVVTPRVPVVGPVDVTVRNSFGSDTLPHGFTYLAQPVDLRIVGEIHVGQPAAFEITGPPSRRYALLADRARGETCFRHGTVCFELAFTSRLVALHDAIRGDDDPLDEFGDGLVIVDIPNKPSLVDRTFWFQAVVKTQGDFIVTPPRGASFRP